VGPPPKTVPLVIERTGDRKIIERSVAERLMAEHKPEAAQEPEEATPKAEETTDSPAEQR
jgi:hypothetical protein